MKICRHCQQYPTNRPRGLCSVCYADLGIRDLYPIESKFGKYTPEAMRTGGGGVLAEPTEELPGTDAKFSILLKRAEQGQPLFHPHDGQHDTN